MIQQTISYRQELLLSRVILHAAHGSSYTIFGRVVVQTAQALADAGLLQIAPILPRNINAHLSYFAITPTQKGEMIWQMHLESPLRPKRGGARIHAGRKPKRKSKYFNGYPTRS